MQLPVSLDLEGFISIFRHMVIEQADTSTLSMSSLEDMIPAGVIEPVLRRPVPFVAAAFGIGLLTGLALRARGGLIPDDSAPSLLRDVARHTSGRWSGRVAAEARGIGSGMESLREELVGRLRTTLTEAAADYLDRAVDRMADATQRAVRP